MRVQYYNRRRLRPEEEEICRYVEFDELIRTSDVLSLNLPLRAETKHIISYPEFEKMKDGVVIVNTARGALMDEEALVAALESGKVASAGLDVYENEPAVHSGLLKNESVILIPHLGTHTYETQKKMEIVVINNVREGITKGRLLTPVN
jgi:glyoxylate reductase